MERRMEKKKKLKELFDNEYDMKGDNEFYDNWKLANEEQAKVLQSKPNLIKILKLQTS